MGIDVEFRFGGHRGDATEAQSRFSKDEAGREVSSELVLQLVERDLAAAFGEAKRRRQAGDSATRDRHVWRVLCHAIPYLDRRSAGIIADAGGRVPRGDQQVRRGPV